MSAPFYRPARFEVHDLRPWRARALDWLRCSACGRIVACPGRIAVLILLALMLLAGSAFAGVGSDEWRPAAAGMGLPTRDAPAGESSVHVDSGRVAFVWSLRAGDSKFARHSSEPARVSSMRGASDVPTQSREGAGGEALQRRALAPDSVTYPGRRESTPGPCRISADGMPSPGCDERSATATLRDWLKSGALLLLLFGSWGVLHWLMFNDAPEDHDEGRVVPGWRPRR